MDTIMLIVIISITILPGCSNNAQNVTINTTSNNTDIAREFINAFYSFDSEKLDSVLSMAPESQSAILYYQKWAECGNYEIIKRGEPIVVNDSLIKCAVTVKDDLIRALKLDFNATDTFYLKITNGYIHSINTSSNDPDLYYEAKEWVRVNLSDLIEEPCEGIMEDGLTPCECVRAMIKGFTEFISTKNSG